MATGSSGRKQPSKELAEAITTTRIHLGLNKAEFARKLNKNFVTIHRWETGQIVPQPAVIAELLLEAPEIARRVFEDRLNKTHEQVLRERQYSLVTGPESPDWKADPGRYRNEIYQAICDGCKWIWLEGGHGNPAADSSLSWLFEAVKHEVEGVRGENRRD